MLKPINSKKLASVFISLILSFTLIPQIAFAANIAVSYSEVTSSSAWVTVMMDITQTETFDEGYLEWSTNNFASIAGSRPLISSTTQSVQITNLLPNTQYYVRAVLYYHTGSSGKQTATSNTSFTTAQESIPVTVYDLSVIPGGGSQAFAAARFSAAGSVTVRNQGFVYSLTNSNPVIEASNATAVGGVYTSSNVFTASFNNLTGTTYYVRAYVEYSEGGTVKYAYSSAVQYTHAQDGAPRVVTGYASLMDGRIYAYGTISSPGNASLSDYGFVYNFNNNSLPTLENSSRAQGSFTSANVNFEASFSASGYSSGICYIRAYAKNNLGTSYGDVVSVDLSKQNNARITLQSVDFVGSDNAQFTIYVPTQGSASIIERGVVLSKTKTPVIDGANVIVVNADRNSTSNVRVGEAVVTVENLEKSTTYYVRAYVKTNTGTYYNSEDDRKIETQKEEAIVTLAVTEITNTSAVAGGKISNNLDYTVRSRGVVYSRTNTVPEIVNSVYVQHEKSESGEFTVTLEKLDPNTTYYVRAYYQTVAGYTYGSVRTFKTEENAYVKVNDVKDIKSGEATIKCNVSSDISYNVSERGVIFSASQSSPNINNSDYRAASSSGTGDYEVILTNLASNTKYYVRAYAKTSQGYTYSPVRDFTTTQNVEIKISYRLSDGTVVGNESISTSINAVITGDMLKVPEGYKLESGASGFKYTVTGSDSVIVVVAPEVKGETAFTEGVGNYMFQPDVPMTRLDVVKMVCNLMGEGKSYDSTVRFSDMPFDYEAVNAINFATSRGIISGYPDGTFGPAKGITRAELAVIIYKAYNLQPNNSVNVSLTDISSHWSRPYVTVAVQNGVISGYEDKTFRPDRQVTRAEAVTMISNASGRSLMPLGVQQFTDVPVTHWAYPFIMNAAIPKP